MSDIFGIVPISLVYNGHRLTADDESRSLTEFGGISDKPTLEVELTEDQVASLEDGGQQTDDESDGD